MAKRILIYTNHFFPEQFKINDIVDWLKDENYSIKVITGIPNYPQGKFYKGYGLFSGKTTEVKDGLVIKRLLLIPRGSGSKILLVFNYISFFISTLIYTFFLILFKKKYDIVLVHHTSPFFISISPVIYKFFKSSKNILWDLDIWPQTLVAMKILKNKIIIRVIDSFIKLIYRQYDEVLISSNFAKEVIKNRVDPKSIHFFPNWAESKIENPKIFSINDLEISKETLNIMYLGNIGEAQDFPSLLKAINNLKSKNVSWYFVGTGRYKNEFQKNIEKFNLQSVVHFIPHQKVEKVYSYAIKADLLFLSLKNEEIFRRTVPAKIQTYMSIGKPIIAMISGETKKLINESKIGIAVDSGDYYKLVDEINKFLKGSYDYSLLSKNSSKLYNLKYRSALRKSQILNLIQSV